jgi:hypothetical protein
MLCKAATFFDFGVGAQQSIHGAFGAQVDTFVEQLCEDLGNRKVGKAIVVQNREYGIAFGLA